LEIWKFGNLKIWKFGNLEIWKFGNLEIWKFVVIHFQKCPILLSNLPMNLYHQHPKFVNFQEYALFYLKIDYFHSKNLLRKQLLQK